MKLDEARVLLGLRPGFSESEFRAAAEGAKRDWWPERFPEGSEYRRVAEERTRTIQQACLVLEGALTSSPRDSERELDNTEPPSVSPDTITPPVSLDSTAVDDVQPQGVTPRSVPGRGGRTYRVLGGVLVVVLGGASVFGIWSQRDSGTDSSLRNGTGEERGFDLSAPVSPEAAAVDASPATVTLTDSLETRQESADSNRVYYSVGLGAFQDQDAARSLLTRVQGLEPSVWAVIAPVDVSGTVYFRVMVGLAGAPEALADVVQAVTRGIGRDVEGWILREVAVTLCLAGPGGSADVAAETARLASQGIAAFLREEPSPSGETLFRVCSGAFSDAEEATFFEDRLRAQGWAPEVWMLPSPTGRT